MVSPFMHGSWGVPFAGALVGLMVVAMLWSLVWKGLALWNAARNRQLYWFVALLIINTAGILEIVYLLFFRADKDTRPFSSLISFDKKQSPAKEDGLPVAESSPAE